MTYAQAMAASSRDLTIRATVTLPDSTVIHLAPSQIMAYSIDEGSTEIPLGSAASASYALEVANANGEWFRGGSIMTNRVLKGARVVVEIGVYHDGAYDYAPAGVWYVEKGSGKEGTTRYTLRGGDQLMYMTEALDDSSFTYQPNTTLNAILNAVKSVHGLTIYGTLQCNAAAIISKRPDWGAGCSVRNALGFIAAAGGCFIQVARDGKLTLVPVKKTGTARAITTDGYLELENTNETFAFNRIKVMPRGAAADDPYIQSYILSGLGETGKNTIVMADNPLFASGATNLQNMVNALKTVLTGYSIDTFSFRHRGDPTWALGDLVTVTDRRAKTVTTPILQQSLKYGNGFSCMISSMMALEMTAPSTISRNGTIMSIGFGQGSVDPSVLIAHSITADHIAAGSITADEIASDSITTRHLQAGAITADKGIIADAAIGTAKIQDAAITSAKIGAAQIDSAHIKEATIDALNADAVTAVEGEFQKITAGTLTSGSIFAGIVDAVKARIGYLIAENLTTDELYARIATIAVAQITAANIEAANIQWADIEALVAEIGTIVTAQIGTADIDWAHIKDLATETAIITEGLAGELYIARLAVTEANIVRLSVGKLMLRGDDGLMYTITVDEDGSIITVPSQVTNDDLMDAGAVIDEGENIIYGGITAGKLNVQEIFAENALIASLIAANIDVDELFAREATIDSLNAKLLLTENYITVTDAISGIESELTENKSYIRLGKLINSDNAEGYGIAIGKSLQLDEDGNIVRDSTAVQITSDRQTFYQNGVVGMELKDGGITAGHGNFGHTTVGGKWRTHVDSNGTYAVMWVG